MKPTARHGLNIYNSPIRSKDQDPLTKVWPRLNHDISHLKRTLGDGGLTVRYLWQGNNETYGEITNLIKTQANNNERKRLRLNKFDRMV